MGGSGKVFEERFWSKPIVSEEQLAVTTLYVDFNEARAGVAPYRGRVWSSAPFHLGELAKSWLPATIWTASSWYSSLGTTRLHRTRAYREWAQAYRERDLERIVECPPLLGPARPSRPDGRRAT